MATSTRGGDNGEGYSSGEDYLMMDSVFFQNQNDLPSPSPAIPIQNKQSPTLSSDGSRHTPQMSRSVTTATQQQQTSENRHDDGSDRKNRNHRPVKQSRSSPVPTPQNFIPDGDQQEAILSSSLPASPRTKPVKYKPRNRLGKSKSGATGIKRTFRNLGNKLRLHSGGGGSGGSGEMHSSSSSPADLPGIPPKPKPRTRKVARSLSESGAGNIALEELAPDFELDEQYGEMTAEEIAIKFGESLPIQLYVAKGTYGTDDSYSLSSEQRCNLHFIQHREVLKLEDTANNAEFAIPLNSSLRFAPIYNHKDETRGHLYPHVSDILEADPLPRLIFACQLCDGTGKNQRELLVVKEVIPAEGEDGLRKMRFYSITKDVEKVLDENVYGHFSTRPSCMLLYIEELLQYIPDPFPMTVGIFQDTSRKQISCGLPQHVFRRGLLLSKRYTDVSFVATTVLEGIEDIRNAQPFEIPTDIDVDFKIVKLSQSEEEQLRKDTEILRKTLSADSVKHYRYANLTEELYKLQTTFYRAVRSKGDKTTAEDDDNRDYSNPMTTNRLQIGHRVQMLETSISRYQETMRTLQPSYDQLVESNQDLIERVTDLEWKLSQQVTLFQTEMNALREEMEELRSSGNGGGDSGRHDEASSPLRRSLQSNSSVHTNPLNDDVSSRNKQLLASMDQSQIQFLLTALGLSQYQDTFTEEGISGDILVECDDQVLEHDLGIKSRIHRIKILTLINGKTSVEMYL